MRGVGTNTTKPVALPDIEMSAVSRIPTTYKEIDRVLGGGIVPGALMLLGGDPGIGKSTLLLQVSQKVADTVGTVLYASGEESQLQLKLRAERLHINSERLHVIADTDLDHILEVALDQNHHYWSSTPYKQCLLQISRQHLVVLVKSVSVHRVYYGFVKNRIFRPLSLVT